LSPASMWGMLSFGKGRVREGFSSSTKRGRIGF
jgi:hypothetical protein